jgi:pyrroline-5-carboxylate reductase
MIGFIGGGNMAEALMKGMTYHGMKEIFVSEPREERREYLKNNYRVKTTGNNRAVAASCRIVVLAVKPQDMDAALAEMTDLVTDEMTVVSIAAGITLGYLQSKLNTRRLVRAMPNSPAMVRKGITVMSLSECFPDTEMALVREMFMSVGKVLILPEKHMDAVTALSGSGPAFVALFAEALKDAGTAMGLAEDNAAELAVQTIVGTAGFLDEGMPPSRLREMVTSPGGTTEAGLRIFDNWGFKSIVTDALQAARKRASELGRRI